MGAASFRLTSCSDNRAWDSGPGKEIPRVNKEIDSGVEGRVAEWAMGGRNDNGIVASELLGRAGHRS